MPMDLAGVAPSAMRNKSAHDSANDSANIAQESAMSDEAVMMEAQEESAELSQFGTLTFKIPSKISLKSDGSSEKVKVSSAKLKGDSTNIAVPYLSTEVFEEVKVTNADVPLLPGSVNIFTDGNFIGNQSLSFVSPGKEFLLPVGISQSVGVKRKLLKKFEDDSGVVRSFRRVTAAYEIEVENYSKVDQKVVILERGVLSGNKKITVKLNKSSIDSLPREDPKRTNKDEGVWEWHIDLSAKDKKVINYELSVEFPSELKVSGVEEL